VIAKAGVERIELALVGVIGAKFEARELFFSEHRGKKGNTENCGEENSDHKNCLRLIQR
jgi:hypothetical protein